MMDRVLYINKVTDTRIREMVNVTGDSTNYDEAKISRSINDIVSLNNYTISSGNNVTCYTSFLLDKNITVSTTGLPNCGSFWGTDTKDWRLYQNKNGNIIITAAEGCKLKSVTIAYNYTNGGNLQHNKYVVPSRTIVAANGNLISLDVGSSNVAMNGQVKITSITVDYYKPHLEEHDYSKDYLTFEALEDGTFTLTVPPPIGTDYMTSISYSIDNGNTWTTTLIENNVSQKITTPTISSGDKVLWKGIGIQLAYSDYYASTFSSTCKFNVSGNIMSLLYGDNFNEELSFPDNSSNTFVKLFEGANINNAQSMILPILTLVNYCYSKMFKNCANLISAPKLPATVLAAYCYGGTDPMKGSGEGMFSGCTSLIEAPELPGITLVDYCYAGMFSGCTSLVNAPELPATTIAISCYDSMFSGCTSLTIAPELPATTLARGCYTGMFKECTSLEKSPDLNALTLVSSCYSSMFFGCSSLNYIKALCLPGSTTTGSTYNWVKNIAATGTFIKNKDAGWATGDNGIPINWTVETADN